MTPTLYNTARAETIRLQAENEQLTATFKDMNKQLTVLHQEVAMANQEKRSCYSNGCTDHGKVIWLTELMQYCCTYIGIAVKHMCDEFVHADVLETGNVV